MSQNEEIKELHIKIDELSDKIGALSEKQNSQYSDIMLILKDIKEAILNPKKEEDNNGKSDEELYEMAVEIVTKSRKASASLLQRRLQIGYSKAARILDLMEEKGIIGPAVGATPREVFIK